MKNRRGQFYLIAAVIVIGLAVILIGVTNFSTSEEKTTAENIFNQLKVESQEILEFGASSGNYPWDDFAKNFSNYAGEKIMIDFVVVNYTTSINYECFRYSASGVKTALTCSENAGQITLSETFNNFVFDVKKGQSIDFVVIEEGEDERYVFSS